MIDTAVGVLTGDVTTYRNVEPKSIIAEQRKTMDQAWTRKYTDGVGRKDPLVEKAYEIEPGTPV